MKAIILAAGMGTRLGNYTKELPKGMLHFLGKSLIERQIETLREAGINDIIIVRGYMPEKIDFQHIRYYLNQEYATTNMVVSLMAAEAELNDEVLVCYSDIIFEPRLVTTLLESTAEVNVLVDDSWLEYWKARTDNWKEDVESLQYDTENFIFELGNTACELKEAQSRYIGMIKFSKEGIKKFKESYYENKKKYWDHDLAWMKSTSFKKAYMTCMLQNLINQGVKIKAVHVNHGWLEFDTAQDYEKALTWVKTGEIKKYINL